MRYLLLILLCFNANNLSAMVNEVPSSNKFSEFIGHLWFDGAKKEVLQLAETRIQRNPNDLASMLICLDYGSEYMEVDRMRDLFPKIKVAILRINTPEFSKQKKFLQGSIEYLEQVLPTVTPEMIQAEAYKGDILHKPLGSLAIIQALEIDGLVPLIQPEERALIEKYFSSNTSGTISQNSTSTSSTTPSSASSIESKTVPIVPTITPAQTVPESYSNRPLFIGGIVIAILAAGAVAWKYLRK